MAEKGDGEWLLRQMVELERAFKDWPAWQREQLTEPPIKFITKSTGGAVVMGQRIEVRVGNCCWQGERFLFFDDEVGSWIFDLDNGMSGPPITYCPFCGTQLSPPKSHV